MASFQRARSDESKEQRRSVMVSAAKALIDKGGFAAVTMEAVAKRSGVAKGTLYLYFGTREDILLSVLMDDFGDWFVGMAGYLGDTRRPFDTQFLEAWLAGVSQQPRLAMGMCYLHLMLEPNISEEFAVAWKTFLLGKLKELHYQLLSEFEPGVSFEMLVEFFTLLTSISVGLWMHTFTPPQIKKTLAKHKEFQVFEVNLPDLFMKAASAILDSPQFFDLQKIGRK